MSLQIVQQVKEALRLGLLDVGDQLPTVREVVASIAINPNTVAKAYRELEREGLVDATPGRGTCVSSTLAWLAQAQRAGMDDEDILALVSRTLQDVLGRRVA